MVKYLAELGKRFAKRRATTVEQLGSDLEALRYARRNQEDAALTREVFQLYFEAESDNFRYRECLKLIHQVTGDALGND